jgi:hypothetical protein
MKAAGSLRPSARREYSGAAIEKAVGYLLRARDRDGLWRDFDTLAGSSDEWVSAYVAHALAESGGDIAVRAARETWDRLRRRRWWAPGWGFNRRVPCDADSTVWVLRLADRLGAGGSWRIGRARRMLDRHVRPGGGMATYGESGPIRLYTRLDTGVSFSGWCGPHVCVTAPAAHVDLANRSKILDFLRAAQRGDGSWSSYWWCDAEYATALAAGALAASGAHSDEPRVARAAEWAAARSRNPEANGSAFACSLRLGILRLSRLPVCVAGARICLDRLLARQEPDGAWPASARLRIPPPDTVDPDGYTAWVHGGRGGGSIQTDSRRCFTTATVLAALSATERRHAA